mmetsp:Transcript_4477/g.20078  ORF Transcript_4477/g.20078 Transcript_4477/m.20078 type:complete len:210 (-) Transcript_4477:1961-2590(-)
MSSDRFTAIRSSWFTLAGGIVARRESVAFPTSSIVELTCLDAVLADASPRAEVRRRGRCVHWKKSQLSSLCRGHVKNSLPKLGPLFFTTLTLHTSSCPVHLGGVISRCTFLHAASAACEAAVAAGPEAAMTGASLFSSSRNTRSCFLPSVLHPRTLRSALRSATFSRLRASNWGRDSGVVLEYSSGTSGTALCRDVAASSLALLSSFSR